MAQTSSSQRGLRPASDSPTTRDYVCVSDVSKTYQTPRNETIEALSHVSLALTNGEFLSVVGPSGCGKSTLLKCIAGLSVPTSGLITVNGRPVKEPPPKMGIVFQRDVLLDWLNIVDNVLLPIRYTRGHNPETARQSAMRLLDMMGLAGFEHNHPWELSGGMRQRVAICRSLLLEPDLLLMDEPFGALDALTRDELNLVLQRIWLRDEKSVLFITHSIQEAVFLSDRVVVMSPGPGRILEMLEIDLPRPRELEIRETPEFGRYSSHIRALLERHGAFRR